MLSDPEAQGTEEALHTTIELNREDFDDKADCYAKLIRSLMADADALKGEEERFVARRKNLENKAEWLKTNLQNSMTALDIKKLKTLLFTYTIQKNPPKLLYDEAALPEEYFIPQPDKVNTEKLKSDLKSGAEIPGAALVQSENLRIR
jgi:hypothetical protein